MEDSFKKRMEYIARLVGNATTLSRLTGISRRTISLYLSGETDPSRERLIKMATVAGVNLEWLATGKGSIGRKTGSLHPEEISIAEDNDYVSLPRYDLDPLDKKNVTEKRFLDNITINKFFLKKNFGVNNFDKIFFTDVHDDSMYPTISKGDLILIDGNRNYINANIIYALYIGKSFTLRRVQVLMGDRIKFICDNPHYESQTIDDGKTLEEITLLGRVIWTCKKT